MLGSIVSIHQFTVPNQFQHHHFFPYNPTSTSRWRWQRSTTLVKCCKRAEQRLRKDKNYYELLGVSVDSSTQCGYIFLRINTWQGDVDVSTKVLCVTVKYCWVIPSNAEVKLRRHLNSDEGTVNLGFISRGRGTRRKALPRQCGRGKISPHTQDIKEAYRKLQKKYHPDIAGQKGHEYTLMLNEACKVLIKEGLRREYDASIGQLRVSFGRNVTDLGYSSWNGPLRPHALFVDENACIGCTECVHHARNTFMMDEALGCARVKVQYGDDESNIQVSVDSCPVNCIHWVEREELAVLEFLIRPQPKEGYGIFGQGWERPKNVFMAAKAFNKQLQQQATNHQRNAQQTVVEEETPAQAEARESASMKLQMDRFSRIWNWVHEILG